MNSIIIIVVIITALHSSHIFSPLHMRRCPYCPRTVCLPTCFFHLFSFLLNLFSQVIQRTKRGKTCLSVYLFFLPGLGSSFLHCFSKESNIILFKHSTGNRHYGIFATRGKRMGFHRVPFCWVRAPTEFVAV